MKESTSSNHICSIYVNKTIININQDTISNHLTVRKGKSQPGQVHMLDKCVHGTGSWYNGTRLLA